MPKIIPPDVRIKLSSKEWLVEHHVHQLFSISELSSILSVTPSVVRKALRLLQIVSPSQQLLREASNMRKYGVGNVGQIADTKMKALSTMAQKYGGHNWSTPNRSKRDATCLALYGDVNVGKTDYSKSKAINTNNTLYGRDHVNQTHFSNSTYKCLNDKDWLIDQHVTQRKSLLQIAAELGFGNDMTTVMRHLRKHNIETKHHQTSHGENQLVDFLESLGIEVVRNSRSLIPPKEIDIYIPSHNLAIEYCGLYWHGELRGKNRTYHKDKYDACQALGIQLITMYDSEWNRNSDIVKKKLQNILGVDTSDVVYARQCTVSPVDTRTKQQFFNQYHIQGNGPGSINYGLYFNNRLVAVMSFVISATEQVLNRYATSDRVVGGFSKLLNHFKQKHTWTRIVSFADLRWGSGNLYHTTGFVLEQTIPVDYAYIVGGQALHKFAFRRRYLPSKLDVYDPAKSEWENMKANGYDRIWDCGKLRFVHENTLQCG